MTRTKKQDAATIERHAAHDVSQHLIQLSESDLRGVVGGTSRAEDDYQWHMGTYFKAKPPQIPNQLHA